MTIPEVLKQHRTALKPLFDPAPSDDNSCTLDLGLDNGDLQWLDVFDADTMHEFIFGRMASLGASYSIGGYLEDRLMYRRSKLFHDESGRARSIHLGTDVWTEEGSAVYLPLDGRVHSFRDNRQPGDYGPTIIVEHQLDGLSFFALYGHLQRDSLSGLAEGMPVSAGQIIGRLGGRAENGDWPPHLHFQLITGMLEKKGDYPGVCFADEISRYRHICPDPAEFFQALHGAH